MNPKKTIRPEHKKQHAKNTIRSIKTALAVISDRSTASGLSDRF